MNHQKLLSAIMYFQNLKQGLKPRLQNEPLKQFETVLKQLAKLAKATKYRMLCSFDCESNETIELDLSKDCSLLFMQIADCYNWIAVDVKAVSISRTLVNSFLKNEKIHIKVRLQALLIEPSYLHKNPKASSLFPDEDYENCVLKLNVLKNASESFNITSSDYSKPLCEVFSQYISKVIKNHIRQGQLLQCLEKLKEILRSLTDPKLRKILIEHKLHYATSFQLATQSELETLLQDNESLFESEELAFNEAAIKGDEHILETEFFRFTSGKLSKDRIVNKDVVTKISFTIPFELIKKQAAWITNDESRFRVDLFPIANFWEDPIFIAMMDWKIGNIGWKYFIDTNSNENKSFTHFQFQFDGLIAPDRELDKDDYPRIDFSEKEAIEGRRYWPHKELVISKLIDAFEVVKKLVKIEKHQVNHNLFSNLVVQYIDKESNESFETTVCPLTTPIAFENTKELFIADVVKNKLEEPLLNIQRLLGEVTIKTERDLSLFLRKLIDICIKDQVENHEVYRFLWATKDAKKIPITEPEAQPLLMHNIKLFAEVIGLKITREASSANGKIDFLATMTNAKGIGLNCCVELKLAHSAKVEEGLTKQLPAYMNAEKASYGIYVVLWFKGDGFGFEKPTAYKTIEDLENYLVNQRISSRFSVLLINCDKPKSPSRL